MYLQDAYAHCTVHVQEAFCAMNHDPCASCQQEVYVVECKGGYSVIIPCITIYIALCV